MDDGLNPNPIIHTANKKYTNSKIFRFCYPYDYVVLIRTSSTSRHPDSPNPSVGWARSPHLHDVISPGTIECDENWFTRQAQSCRLTCSESRIFFSFVPAARPKCNRCRQHTTELYCTCSRGSNIRGPSSGEEHRKQQTLLSLKGRRVVFFSFSVPQRRDLDFDRVLLLLGVVGLRVRVVKGGRIFYL